MKSRQPLTKRQNGANSGGETRKMGVHSPPMWRFFYCLHNDLKKMGVETNNEKKTLYVGISD
jgi:hypothetical protein